MLAQRGCLGRELYRQPDLRAEIDRIRTSGSATTATVPALQRASTESLRRRLEATLDENARLRTENHQLRQHVAQRFGQERADGHTRPRRRLVHDTNTCPATFTDFRLQMSVNTKLRLRTYIAYGLRSTTTSSPSVSSTAATAHPYQADGRRMAHGSVSRANFRHLGGYETAAGLACD